MLKNLVQEFETFQFLIPDESRIESVICFVERIFIKRSLLKIAEILDIKFSGRWVTLSTFQLSQEDRLRMRERFSRFESLGSYTLRDEMGSREQYMRRPLT